MLSSNRWGHMQINHLGRRKFITLLGGAAVPWPLAAGAQQPSMPVIGFLNPRSLRSDSRLVTAFHQGLGETGYVQGKNVAIEYRWAEGHNDRLPALTADLVRRQVAVIVATGGNVSALAAQAVSTTIPIVFTLGGDPIMLGLVTSLSRPGGNITGISALTGLLGAKRLELLHELVPKAMMIGIVMNPTNPIAEAYARDLKGPHARVGSKSISRMRALKVRSTPRSRVWSNCGPERFLSLPMRSSLGGAINSSRWRPAMQFQRSTKTATSPLPAA
jgi:ABC-type uncharacterized transport system substrate-binding protein